MALFSYAFAFIESYVCACKILCSTPFLIHSHFLLYPLTTFPFKFHLLFILPTESIYVHEYRVIYWNMLSLFGSTFLKKTDTSSPSIH